MDLLRTRAVSARALRLAASAGLLATLGAPSLAAQAATLQPSLTSSTTADCAIQLRVDSPNPGDVVYPGGYVLSGIARDVRAPSGTGIQSVRAFLGDRDQGGLLLGTGTFPDSAPLGTFTLNASLPSNASGLNSIYVYAMNTSGQEAVVSDPVLLNQSVSDYTKATGATVPTGAFASCPQTMATAPAPVTGGASTPSQAPAAPAPSGGAAAAPAPVAPAIHLVVGNPNPGDWVPQGSSMSIGGVAFDSGAASGNGIDRVSVFFENRDRGGQFLGSAVPSKSSMVPVPSAQFANAGFDIPVTLPSNLAGQHTLYIYATASSGKEALQTVFINIQSNSSS